MYPYSSECRDRKNLEIMCIDSETGPKNEQSAQEADLIEYKTTVEKDHNKCGSKRGSAHVVVGNCSDSGASKI